MVQIRVEINGALIDINLGETPTPEQISAAVSSISVLASGTSNQFPNTPTPSSIRTRAQDSERAPIHSPIPPIPQSSIETPPEQSAAGEPDYAPIQALNQSLFNAPTQVSSPSVMSSTRSRPPSPVPNRKRSHSTLQDVNGVPRSQKRSKVRPGANARSIEQLPVVRIAEYREGRTEPTNMRLTTVETKLAYQRGQIAPTPCTKCQRGSGLFKECVVLPGFFSGACCSCSMNNTHHCSLRNPAESRPRRRKRKSRSENQSTNVSHQQHSVQFSNLSQTAPPASTFPTASTSARSIQPPEPNVLLHTDPASDSFWELTDEDNEDESLSIGVGAGDVSNRERPPPITSDIHTMDHPSRSPLKISMPSFTM